jgi:hypothetical protein
MTSALRILEQITTDFTIFEKNQVLTESQLNSVTDYLNDQARLMRIHLLGVGVVAGLRVSISSDVITATKGVGITTDGDLLYYSNDIVFDRFLEYGNTYPKYAPFYVGVAPEETMIPVYELIARDAPDPRSAIFPLSEFTIQTTKELKNMVAVLLMESYINDPDICTGTDCDNLGKDCINTPKLLLVENSYINSLLNPAIATPDKAFSTFNEIVADRPPISASISSTSQLTQIYQTVCTSIFNKLFAEIPNLYLKCSSFLADVFSSDPTNIWRTKLTSIHNNSLGSVGIQYYYDFLKDVVETYNQFWELLFGDMTWLCPDINWFPKHLLLGNLILDSNLDENRTAFYPSPAVSQTSDNLQHAKFLARKLDTLIQTFEVPTAFIKFPIRITPSLFEDQPLEERAIPYYYPVNTTNPIHKSWNYRLHQRRMDNFNYSYNAIAYGAEGGAINPFASQIGRFSFFRIEGHLGQKLEVVVSAIYEMIQSYNIPCSLLIARLGELSQRGEVSLSDLISQHPGIEHFGGVLRGGTFVLLTDANNETVIADFMLPYYVSPPRNNIVAADGLNSKRERLVRIGYQAVFGSSSDHSASQASKCLRDLGYYLDAVIESCRQDSVPYLDEFISRMKELNKGLYSNNWFVAFYQSVKSNHGLTGETAKIANFYLDRAIAGLYSYNIEAADGLNSKRDQLIKSGYQAVIVSSQITHNSRQGSACLRDLGYYLNAIIESCRRDSLIYFDEFSSDIKETNRSLGYPNSWFVTFYQSVKSNHGLTGEVAKVANSYLDHAITSFG